MKVQYHFQKVAYGSDLSRRRLPFMELHSGVKGPVVWLTACAHGDEVTGSVVIQDLFKRLRKFRLLKGSIFAFPLMNPLGFEISSRQVPASEEDLNRSFPGDEKGTFAERIASQIFASIVKTKPDLVLDLHNDWTKAVPYVVLDPLMKSDAYARAEHFANVTGLLVVREVDHDEGTLSGTLLSRNIPALTLELGESYVVNEAFVDVGVKSVLNVLCDLGMISGYAPFTYNRADKVLSYSDEPRTNKSGIIRFFIGPGEKVVKGQVVAKVYNAFGRQLEALAAPGDGLVISHSDFSISVPGSSVIVFGLR